MVPPNTGICHQVNLEYLARVVETRDGQAYPDTLVGTDSHTTMINGLGVLGWGVGGIEAEAAMLGQPVSMLIPQVVGFRLTGELPEGATATDLVLTVTQMLRERGVVGKFVEFFGPGLTGLPLADRATIGNMAPEYGATCGIFPVDAETLRYLEFSGRPAERVELVEAYCRAAGALPRRGRRGRGLLGHARARPGRRRAARWPARSARRTAWRLRRGRGLPRGAGGDRPTTTRSPATTRPPRRPSPRAIRPRPTGAATEPQARAHGTARDRRRWSGARALDHGAVVIAAITSCTNTSNPSVMLGAGLLAKKAVEAGLTRKPWVKTSLAPGSKVVTEYLERAGLIEPLSQLGFDLVGLRLHHVHRQLRAAAARRSRARSRSATSWSLACCRATATSRAASTPR